MIVDSSALVAIVAGEPERGLFLDRLADAPVKRMSSASFLETSIVLNRAKGPAGVSLLEKLLGDADIHVIDLIRAQARVAYEAYKRFGKGMGHPAQLNILDCCTYALAAESGDPILFKGADFGKTDIAIIR